MANSEINIKKETVRKQTYISKIIKKAKQKVSGMPITTNYNKPDGARMVLERAGIENVNFWSAAVETALMEATQIIPAETNSWLEKISEPRDGPLAFKTLFEGNIARNIGKPKYLNGRPNYFPDIPGDWPSHEGPYKYAVIDQGYFTALPDIPTFFTSDHKMLDYVGSKYRSLINFYDIDLKNVLETAQYYDCTALVIVDDIWEMNYCHWLCDWLPRLVVCKLAFPGEKIKIITNKLISHAQKDSLKLLGFDEDDIIPFDRMQAGQFKRLIAPNDLGQINHPAHKGAEWALDYLKDILNNEDDDAFNYPENIYISRADAPGRKLLNEEAFTAEISKLGFKTIIMSEHNFLRQAKLFNKAKNIIGIHGAGLTNIVFSTSETKLVEVTPSSYGMPSFFILSGAQGIDYATYVTESDAGKITPHDNLIVDVDDFFMKAKAFFNL